MKINYDDLLHVIAQVIRNSIASNSFHLDENKNIITVDTPRDLCEFVFEIFEELHIEIK